MLKRFALAATLALPMVTPAMAQTATNLITNGDFNGNAGEIMPPSVTTLSNRETQISGWFDATTTVSPSSQCSNTTCNQGYPFDFVAAAGTATSTGFPDAWDNGNREVWGNANGANNGFNGQSPDGGNFLIQDGDYHRTAIQQNVAGMVAGQSYTLSFDWAAGQWSGNYGATTEQYQVSIGDQTYNTQTINLASQGFSGWMHSTFTFTWDGSSDLLSFLGYGTPVGEPPLLMLDGVSMTVPEPAAWTLLGVGLLCMGGLARRRRAGLIAA